MNATTRVRSVMTEAALVDADAALVVDAEPAEHRSGARRELLPRHEVRGCSASVSTISSPGASAKRRAASPPRPIVALDSAYVTRLIAAVAPEVHTISRRPPRRSARPRSGRPRTPRSPPPRAGAPAVHRGVALLVEVHLGVEDDLRLLGGGARVEVDERATATHRAGEQREVGSHGGELGGAQPGPHGVGVVIVVSPRWFWRRPVGVRPACPAQARPTTLVRVGPACEGRSGRGAPVRKRS